MMREMCDMMNTASCPMCRMNISDRILSLCL